MFTSGHLTIEPFKVEQVTFFVIGSELRQQGVLMPGHKLVSLITGQPTIDLELWAFTDQETAGNFTELNRMRDYGKKYLKTAVRLARQQGYIVTGTHWGGRIGQDELAIYESALFTKIWEFPAEKP